MTDILHRLKGDRCEEGWPCTAESCACKLMDEAADEITRLRAECQPSREPDIADRLLRLAHNSAPERQERIVNEAMIEAAGEILRLRKMIVSTRN